MNGRDERDYLTAHALGEARTEQLWAMDAELARNPDARAELQAIRSTAALLEQELVQPTGLALSAEQRARILSGPGTVKAEVGGAADRDRSSEREDRARRRVAIGGALMVAACAWLLVVRTDSPRQVVEEETQVTEFLAAPGDVGPVDGFLDRVEGGTFPGQTPQAAVRAAPPGERYDQHPENPFVEVADDPRSTFSIDVDTASYALVRRFLREGQLPPKGAVRIEELVNYFTYAYPEPTSKHPFSLTAEVADAPWAREHRLLRVGLKAREVSRARRPASNLVFLIDVSGSMADANKLPLLKQGLRMLVHELDERDRLSIVVYAGESGLVLPATPGDRKRTILAAIDRLGAGGSTNGGAGITQAYATAAEHFVSGGVNRVLLATDGDFNVGVTDRAELIELIQEKARTGVFLSVLGFGTGNYKDAVLEQLADEGNGNYAYIDGPSEARKVLVEQAQGTLITLAKDVKLQLEFNPAEVSAYRLLGYENRVLDHRDFHDDREDAGELGAGHTVTAFYELVPADGAGGRALDALKYQQPAAQPPRADHASELLTIKVRYKLPEEHESALFELAVRDSTLRAQDASADFRFGAAVAAFGMLLRESPHAGDASYAMVSSLAESALGRGRDLEARQELIELVRTARALGQPAR